MLRLRLVQVIVLISTLGIGAALTAGCAAAQSDSELEALNQRRIELHSSGKYDEAIPLAQRYAEALRGRDGAEHPKYASALHDLAVLLGATDRRPEAESLYRRALEIDEKSYGPEHPNVALRLHYLGGLLWVTNRLAEAEALYRRTIRIREKSQGPNHLQFAASLNNLAELLRATDRLAEAELLYRRAIAIWEKNLDPQYAVGLNNLAELLYATNRLAEAEQLNRLALEVMEKDVGPEHPWFAGGLNSLAELLYATGRVAEAESLFRRVLAIDEKAFGLEHDHVATDLNNLAELLRESNRHGDAEPLYWRALGIMEKRYGPEHPDVADILNNLSLLKAEVDEWTAAAGIGRRATPNLIARKRERIQLGLNVGSLKTAVTRRAQALRLHARAVHRAFGDNHASAEESFELAQWALQTGTADALAQMSVRFAKDAGPLAGSVRRRQDLVTRRDTEDRRLLAAVGAADAKGTEALRATVAKLDEDLRAIDTQLAAEFPEYAALSNPRPLTIAAVQALLRPDEALIVFLDVPRFGRLPEESLAWVITKSDMRWVKSDLGTTALTREVAALRCGLDGALWDDEAGAGRCRDLLKAAPQRGARGDILGETLPFDTARAHALYKALFGKVEDLIAGKHLLVVPSGPLTQLPFQVLVTALLAKAGTSSTAWLARKHAVTVLPAVSSLQALRRVSKPSAAIKQMIGFGNPLLDGNPAEVPDHAKWVVLALKKQTCDALQPQQVADATRKVRGVLRVPTSSGRADLDHLRSQSPLHDTADELCAVAQDLKLAPDDILLGARATEAAIKNLSTDGKLAEYRVLHFATHGTIAGEIEGTSEPGLILTPPKEQTELDDGYLSASEVAGLKLDADWVILSACNSAAGGAQGAEALSGLARAFFYAGARAMLVSHWAVDSEATVKLIISAVGATTRDKSLGRAEALRRAMLALIDTGEPREAHPAYWAPFIVVGEGASPGQ